MRFGVLYVDPPWSYKVYSKKGQGRSAENHYSTMVKLLELALTMHPDFLVVAEMKSEESLQAIKAANTGHTSLTTIHANGCEDTYYRMKVRPSL